MIPLSLGPITVEYTNWRGESRRRHIAVDSPPLWGSTEYHPEPQWLVRAMDLEDPARPVKLFALRDMRPIEESDL